MTDFVNIVFLCGVRLGCFGGIVVLLVLCGRESVLDLFWLVCLSKFSLGVLSPVQRW